METPLRIYGTADDSIVDGPGIRFAVFAQGCPHRCAGCHNPQALDFDGGRAVSLEELKERIEGNPLLSGITLSGGEPFAQPAPLMELACWARQLARVSMSGKPLSPLDVWAYSGFTYEELCAGTPSPAATALLEQCDVLVDGPFILSQQSHTLKWRGSSNQRIIDVAASRAAGKAVLL